MKFVLCFTIVYFCFFSSSVEAAEIANARIYLNTEILQERIDRPTQQEGIEAIDLGNFIIDLEKQDDDFSDLFYLLLKNKLSKRDRPIVLDLTNSLVRGNFDISKIGFSTPITEGAFSGLLTPTEREQIKELNLFLQPAKLGISEINVFRGLLKLERTTFTESVDFSRTWFLNKITATAINIRQNLNCSDSLFAKEVNFNESIFNNELNFSSARFLSPTQFKDAKFQGITNFNRSDFEAAVYFNNAVFLQLADYTRSIFRQAANFSNANWRDRAIFSKSKFLSLLTFNGTTFEKTVAFRDAYFNALVNFKNVNLLDRIDFSNAFFSPQAKINVSGLAFDAEAAKIIGDSGNIGKVVEVDSLEENQTIIRNLIRNFRSLEQINDANQIEYQREKLHLIHLSNLIITTSWQKAFSLAFMGHILSWLSLSLLLLLGDYGTNINLVFSAGMITLAFFSSLFWLLDRYRPNINSPIIPTRYETIFMLGSYLILTLFAISNIFITSNKPWLTLFCIATIILPFPLTLITRIYWRGRYHPLLNISYFVENGELRQFRLLLGRMPIIPRFPFYRDRYEPILWDRRWAWLNYYDFSLNNIFKLGFNDIRLRDRHLPGIIATLVWYQWILGGLYIILLLWTLSRTIPGLNLLIYF